MVGEDRVSGNFFENGTFSSTNKNRQQGAVTVFKKQICFYVFVD
jgi:hypothetical protein